MKVSSLLYEVDEKNGNKSPSEARASLALSHPT